MLELPRRRRLLLLKLCYFSQLLFDSNTAWHIFVGCSTMATGFAVSSDFCSFFFPFCYYNENHRVTKRTAEIKACRGITRLVCFLFVPKKPKLYAMSRASRLACHSGTSKLKFYRADQWPDGACMRYVSSHSTYCVTAASIGCFSIALHWLILMRLDRLSQPALMSTKLHQRISIPDYIQH